MRHAILLAAAIATASAATAEEVRLCGGGFVPAEADGRLLNHFPYRPAAGAELVRPPRALAGQCAAIHRDMRADLDALLARARAELGTGDAVIAVSCFRSRQHQTRIFCRNGRSTAPLVQAYQVAPPGFSEHATGLAIDFGDRRGRCKLVTCFANTAAGRWLAKNAPEFGFELSFPEGNAQGVAFEPWHWRWVGRDGSSPSRRAQAIFAAARARSPEPPEQFRPSLFAATVVRQLADATAALARLAPSSPLAITTAAAGLDSRPFVSPAPALTPETHSPH
jgi:D-alanyl-D-alanine carboxypeptidase